MESVKGAINSIIQKIEEECEREDLEGIYMSASPKDDRQNRLFGKFFFFTTVSTPVGTKGIYIGESEGTTFEGNIPQMIVFEEEDVAGVLFDEFPTNRLTVPEMSNLIAMLSGYLNKTLAAESITTKNMKDIKPFMMPESKTLH